MDYTKQIIISFVLITAAAFFAGPTTIIAQDDRSYELLPAPDLWFNSVDGIRVGGRVRGQMSGTFGDGPHRLDAGIWLGTKIPTHPVSYYISLTEPIPSLSEFGSEANIRGRSSFRTGFQTHGLSFNKRWQKGFDETNYTELSLGMDAQRHFEESYLLYSQLWQQEWLFPISVNLLKTNDNRLGRYVFSISADANILGKYNNFSKAVITFKQRIPLTESVTLNSHLFTGLATTNTAPEHLFSRSFKTGRKWMNSGWTRARGTIPPSWMQSGNIQVTGDANLRGYTHQDIDLLNERTAPLYTSFSAVNLELDYPNPLNKVIKTIPVAGEFIELHSYLFFDTGTSLGLREEEQNTLFSDAGPGFMFSINIPDYLGKNRGLMLRYDLPLWLSHPGDASSFKFRNVIGLGAVINL
ncbi:hypothetical protein LQ318_03385 [Aliifodinibius salicampi]|uniref:Surface antigen n=1 Tax=Fodinibius salicampi TaxID=1920655 RepID=A0ABT3PVQ0_9BACT|nr:hypothetical protein [Fodinibius salicampi]MCW9711939.1 hypothetical protein [Fodinibius salicampi]